MRKNLKKINVILDIQTLSVYTNVQYRFLQILTCIYIHIIHIYETYLGPYMYIHIILYTYLYTLYFYIYEINFQRTYFLLRSREKCKCIKFIVLLILYIIVYITQINTNSIVYSLPTTPSNENNRNGFSPYQENYNR